MENINKELKNIQKEVHDVIEAEDSGSLIIWDKKRENFLTREINHIVELLIEEEIEKEVNKNKNILGAMMCYGREETLSVIRKKNPNILTIW